MRVRLVRRWGSTPVGESVDVDPTQGRWLVDHAFGTAIAEPAPAQVASAPGEAESDPLASGDDGDESKPASGSPSGQSRTRRRRKAGSES